jgi:hypothetical protein
MIFTRTACLLFLRKFLVLFLKTNKFFEFSLFSGFSISRRVKAVDRLNIYTLKCRIQKHFCILIIKRCFLSSLEISLQHCQNSSYFKEFILPGQTAAIKYRQLNTNSLLLPKQSRNKSCVIGFSTKIFGKYL